MSNNNPSYQWRPATMGDIGSVARFCDFEEGPFSFGLLSKIGKGEDGNFYYVRDSTRSSNRSELQFVPYVICHIQYDANKEP